MRRDMEVTDCRGHNSVMVGRDMEVTELWKRMYAIDRLS